MAVIGKQLLSASSRDARERNDEDLEEVRALLTPGKSTRGGSLIDSDRAHDIGEAASSPGEVLPADIARRLATELGVDVGDVRIHTDERAAKAAAAIAARAFSVGNDIYFAAGAYQPGTDETDRFARALRTTRRESHGAGEVERVATGFTMTRLLGRSMAACSSFPQLPNPNFRILRNENRHL